MKVAGQIERHSYKETSLKNIDGYHKQKVFKIYMTGEFGEITGQKGYNLLAVKYH